MSSCSHAHSSEITVSTLDALGSLIMEVPHLDSIQMFQPFIHAHSLTPFTIHWNPSSKNHLKEITSVYHSLSSEKCPTWTSPAPKAIKFLLKCMKEWLREKESPWKEEVKETHEKKKTLTFVNTRCHKFVLEFWLWKSKALGHNFLWEAVAPSLPVRAWRRAEWALLAREQAGGRCIL